MSQTNHFIPSSGQIGPWAANYSEKIVVLGQKIGLTPEQITAQQEAALRIVSKRNKLEQKKKELAEAVSDMKLLRGNDLKIICAAVVGYKRHAGFTDNIGHELGVMASMSNRDMQTLKPSIKLQTEPGIVKITFNKKRMSGVTIFSRLKGSTGWDELVSTKSSPYLDTRPLAEAGKPETREYMARCYDGFKDIGQESDIATIVFGG